MRAHETILSLDRLSVRLPGGAVSGGTAAMSCLV